jgi:uncharacterized protein
MRPGARSGAHRRAGLNPLAAVANSVRQPAGLRRRAHRQWPLPARPWVMGQTWERLAFLHWPVDPDVLADVLPPGVEPDLYDGSAWVGVTPFEVHSFRLRLTLPVPLISTFPEINVRTYVTSAAKPGIWFMSLDTSSRLAVLAARMAYRLPYHHAGRQASRQHGAWVQFASVRGDGGARFAARYRPTGPVREAQAGSFEHFMAERYCLYTVDEQLQLLRGDIHHRPWPLQPADVEITENTMARPYGIELTGDPRVHYAERLDVVFWRLVPDVPGRPSA